MSTAVTNFKRTVNHTKLSTPVYYVDLTLRDGINLQEAISSAKQMDELSKAVGFYQEALDHVAWQGYGNARFEVNSEEGLDLVEEFYTDEIAESEQVQSEPKGKAKPKPRFNQGDGFVQDIQKGLQQNVQIVN